MIDFAYYLIESSVCITAFYIIYYWLMRKESYFRLNRLFLLFSMLFAIFVPAINITFLLNHTSTETTYTFLKSIVFSAQSISDSVYRIDPVLVAKEDSFWTMIFFIASGIYGLGLFIRLTGFIRKLFRLLTRIRKSEKIKDKGFSYIITGENEKKVYSFFRYIFISKDQLHEETYKPVIEHEKAHVMHFHSIDLIFVELLIVLQWFNPFIYLLRKMVVENHEYEADQSVLQSSVSHEKYLRLILNQVISNHHYAMTSAFSYSLSKNRLKMMTKLKKTSSISYYKVLAVIPVALILFFFMACSEDETSPKQEEATTKSLNIKEGDIYLAPDQMPLYDGEKNIAAFRLDVMKNLTYPEKARNQSLEGTVYISFVINEEGKIIDEVVLRGAHPLLDEAALNGLKGLADWEPGRVDGEPVKTQFTIPIVFKL